MVADEPDRYEDETLPPPLFSAYDAVNAYEAETDVADVEEETAYDELTDVTDTDEVKAYDAVATAPSK